MPYAADTLYELSFSERRDWLRLIRTPTVGPAAFRDLLRLYKTAATALDALPALTKHKTVKIPPIHQIEEELRACEEMGIQVIAACEPAYPQYLRAISPPPPLISVWGDPAHLRRPCAAIVGSRNASAIGRQFAAQIANELGDAGYVVVSGLARGIDTSAHTGALDTGTVAVLGGGVDHIYPKQNTDLFNAIRERGALVSESALGHRATARDFPRRNRIISGLSLGVIVIEAAERSGTLITARYALEQNREVMAAPGSPLDPRTKGCNRLIRQGAALIENTDDVIRILGGLNTDLFQEPSNHYTARNTNQTVPPEGLGDVRQIITDLLSPTPTPRDQIIRLARLPAQHTIAALLEMELSGEIHVEPDGKVGTKL